MEPPEFLIRSETTHLQRTTSLSHGKQASSLYPQEQTSASTEKSNARPTMPRYEVTILAAMPFLGTTGASFLIEETLQSSWKSRKTYVQRCRTVRLTHASKGAIPDRQLVYNTQRVLVGY